MSRTTIGLLIFGLLSFSSVSQAGFFVEPMITYENGNTNVNYPSPFENSTGSIKGIGLGGRLGGHIKEMFFAGLDVRYALPQFKDSSVNYDSKAVSINWGPMIGAQMPVQGLRGWGSYIWGGDINPEASGSFDLKFEKGSGFRLGGGYQVNVFSINLEYQQINYASTTVEKFGPFTSDSTFGDTSMQNKSWVVSVSFPMEM